MDLSMLLQVGGSIAGALGVYVGVRADLARLHERTAAMQRDTDRLMSRCFGAASCAVRQP